MIIASTFQFLSSRSPPLCNAIYPEQFPQKHPLPAISFEKNGDDSEPLIDGTVSSLHTALMTINCYDASILIAEQLAKRVVAEMANYNGPFGSVEAKWIQKESEVAAPETDLGLRGIALTFLIAYTYPDAV